MAKKLKKEELELMSYNDIAHMLLKEKPKQMTLDLFTTIGEMLELPKQTIENKIGEFYTALTNDKRFILLENGTWDLQQNHKVKQLSEEEELEDFEEETEDYDDEEVEKEDEMFDNEETDDDIADITEEYKNLVIVDEEELSQE
ncbi:MAG: DNA-directed RNA polymerase subunit delta [Bacilli bacterium]|nr:DNA-directed RNA polymerase subunit delta [Bacilli bacterium]